MTPKFILGLAFIPSVARKMQKKMGLEKGSLLVPHLWHTEFPCGKVVFTAWGGGKWPLYPDGKPEMTNHCRLNYGAIRDIQQIETVNIVVIDDTDKDNARKTIKQHLEKADHNSGLFFLGSPDTLDGTFLEALGLDTTSTMSPADTAFWHQLGVTVKGRHLKISHYLTGGK